MPEYNRAKTIDTYFQKVASGELDFSKLRKTLEAANIEKSEIDVIVPFIDKKIMRADAIKADQATGKNLFYGGLILTAVGLIGSVGTFTGLIDLGGVGIIAFGPVGLGLILLLVGRSKMNRSY